MSLQNSGVLFTSMYSIVLNLYWFLWRIQEWWQLLRKWSSLKAVNLLIDWLHTPVSHCMAIFSSHKPLSLISQLVSNGLHMVTCLLNLRDLWLQPKIKLWQPEQSDIYFHLLSLQSVVYVVIVMNHIIQHLVIGCSVLAGGSYKLCHDKVASNVHWHLCGKYDLERPVNWWEHFPEAVLENSMVKIFLDFNTVSTQTIPFMLEDQISLLLLTRLCIQYL